MSSTEHSLLSSYRESLLEHLLRGGSDAACLALRASPSEVLKPQVDDGGYDLVLEAGNVAGISSSRLHSRDRRPAGSMSISASRVNPSGCIICMMFDPLDIEPRPVLLVWWHAGRTTCPTSRHSRLQSTPRRDSAGAKAARPNHRVVPLSAFTHAPTLPHWRSCFSARRIAGRGFVELTIRVTPHGGHRVAIKQKRSRNNCPGYRNRNGQIVVRATDLPGNDHLQRGLRPSLRKLPNAIRCQWE
jgi:hypothetical protein